MNHFTEESINLANQANYLDLLFSVYHPRFGSFGKIGNFKWQARIPFLYWVKRGVLGMNAVEIDAFSKEMNNVFLYGDGNSLTQFAKKHLGFAYNPDFIVYRNNKYVIGFVNFFYKMAGIPLSVTRKLVNILGEHNGLYETVYVMDGFPYRNNRTSGFIELTQNDNPVFSALLLREYLYS